MSPQSLPDTDILPFAVDEVPRLICRLDDLSLLSYEPRMAGGRTSREESQCPMRTHFLVLG